MSDTAIHTQVHATTARPRTAQSAVIKGKSEESSLISAQETTASTGARTAYPTARTAGTVPEGEGSFWSFFKGLVDVINPLQHIPVVSTFYRKVTGDKISPVARMAGDTLYGGPVGAALAMADTISESSTGRDIGSNVLAMVGGGAAGAASKASGTAVAAAATLNEITPAAGPKIKDIIWQTPDVTVSRMSKANPASHRIGTDAARKTPAELSLPYRSLVSTEKNGQITGRTPVTPPADPTSADGRFARHEMPAGHSADSTPVLFSQDAPAEIARMVTPPAQIVSSADKGLVPQKMMEALDKYNALHKTRQSQGFSAAY